MGYIYICIQIDEIRYSHSIYLRTAPDRCITEAKGSSMCKKGHQSIRLTIAIDLNTKMLKPWSMPT